MTTKMIFVTIMRRRLNIRKKIPLLYSKYYRNRKYNENLNRILEENNLKSHKLRNHACSKMQLILYKVIGKTNAWTLYLKRQVPPPPSASSAATTITKSMKSNSRTERAFWKISRRAGSSRQNSAFAVENKMSCCLLSLTKISATEAPPKSVASATVELNGSRQVDFSELPSAEVVTKSSKVSQ